MDIEKLKYSISSILKNKFQSGNRANYFNYHFAKIGRVRNESELRVLLSDMRNYYADLTREFRKLQSEYETLSKNHASNKELNNVALKMNYIIDETDVLYEMIDIIQESFTAKATNKFINNKQNTINKAISNNQDYKTHNATNKTVQNTVSKPVQNPNPLFRGYKPEYSTDSHTSTFFKYSYEISKKYIAYRNSGFKDNNIMKEIGILTNKRRKFVENAFSTNSKYASLYAMLNDVELAERDTYSDIDYNKYPTAYKNSNDYIEALKNSFRKISETAFKNPNDTALRISNMRFHNNMILSILSQEDIKSKEYKNILGISDGIINKIITYDVYGNDDDFLKSLANKKIATQMVTPNMISSTKKSVNDEQKELFDMLLSRIKDKNKEIKVEDCYITLEQKEQLLFDKYFALCGSILNVKNNSFNRKG